MTISSISSDDYCMLGSGFLLVCQHSIIVAKFGMQFQKGYFEINVYVDIHFHLVQIFDLLQLLYFPTII